jgi:hypothetical protein
VEQGHLLRCAVAAAAAVVAVLLLFPQHAKADPPAARGVAPFHELSAAQRATLRGIAQDTWKFFGADVDPATNLPMDNLTFAGGSPTPTGYGRYTSASNIGVYLWASSPRTTSA